MENRIYTLELARIYEGQGHYQDAFDIYSSLKETHPDNEITAGFNRMKNRMEKKADQASSPDRDGEKDDLKELVLSLTSDLNDDVEESTPPDEIQDDKELPGDRVKPLLEKWMSLLCIQEQSGALGKIKNKV